MALHLYNFTLQNPGAVTHAVAGSFVDAEPNQILVARGHILELLRFDGIKSFHIIVSTEVFGVIRSLATFRLHGTIFLGFALF
jgi:splicing factor 3B subunit 3